MNLEMLFTEAFSTPILPLKKPRNFCLFILCSLIFLFCISLFTQTLKFLKNREKAMECKTEETEQSSSVARLPLFSIPHQAMDSPERSGMLTPPIYAAVSVPFRWEEEPGKPRFSTVATVAAAAASPSLELPPRLLLMDKVARSECSSSFRMMGSSFSHDEMSSLFIRKRGWFGPWRRRGFGLRSKRDQVGIGGLVFPSLELEEEASRFRRNGSFSSLISTQIRPHFWESVCGGLKHLVPSWRSKRMKREA